MLIITNFGDIRNNGVFPSKKGQTHRFAPTIFGAVGANYKRTFLPLKILKNFLDW
jgi:hypothetical protein